MGQCRTLDADVTTGCYYGDYSSCDNTIPTFLFIWNKIFSLTLVCLLFLIKVTANYCIASLILDMYVEYLYPLYYSIL